MKKKIFITGSTDGIGKLAAIKLAETGHELILHGRNAEKLKSVIDELQLKTKHPNLTGYVADLSDLPATKRMAEQLSNDHSPIDVLINNAGVFLSGSPRTDNGMDIRFVVNYLAVVVLTNALLPDLLSAEAPRVISLSSAAQAPVSLEALSGQQSLTDQAAYAQSKLALTMWNIEMARLHPGITFIAVNPGSLLNTKMVQEAYGKHWSPADKGADILVELATSDQHLVMSGKYFDNDRGAYGNAHPDASSQENINQLLQRTEEIIRQQHGL